MRLSNYSAVEARLKLHIIKGLFVPSRSFLLLSRVSISTNTCAVLSYHPRMIQHSGHSFLPNWWKGGHLHAFCLYEISGATWAHALLHAHNLEYGSVGDTWGFVGLWQGILGAQGVWHRIALTFCASTALFFSTSFTCQASQCLSNTQPEWISHVILMHSAGRYSGCWRCISHVPTDTCSTSGYQERLLHTF